MATSILDIQNLLRETDHRFLVSDDGQTICVPYCGPRGTVHVMIRSDEDEFVQFRSNDIPALSKEDPAADAIRQELLALNYEMRFLKLGLDPNDGQIVGYGDAWIMDNTLTTAQFSRMLNNFISAMAEAMDRIRATARSGKCKYEHEFDAMFANLLASPLPGPAAGSTEPSLPPGSDQAAA